MLPMIVSGVTCGVMLNILMPDILVSIAFILVLSILGYGVAKKAWLLHKKEKASRVKDKNEDNKEEEKKEDNI